MQWICGIPSKFWVFCCSRGHATHLKFLNQFKQWSQLERFVGIALNGYSIISFIWLWPLMPALWKAAQINKTPKIATQSSGAFMFSRKCWPQNWTCSTNAKHSESVTNLKLRSIFGHYYTQVNTIKLNYFRWHTLTVLFTNKSGCAWLRKKETTLYNHSGARAMCRIGDYWLP